METTVRFVTWICGKIDKRYGECLYGVSHVEPEGSGFTLCGQRAYEHTTQTTSWWKDDYGSTHPSAESASCKACRRAAGLETKKWEESTYML